jgi:beta-mannanase
MAIENSSSRSLVNQSLWEEDYDDLEGHFGKTPNFSALKVFKNGSYSEGEVSELRAKNDYKFEFFRDTEVRYVDKSNGFALTFPLSSGVFPVDYTLAKYGVKVVYPASEYRLTYEENYYADSVGGWSTYIGEWFDRYLINDTYLKNNNLSRYGVNFVGREDYLNGYEVSVMSIKINDAKDVGKPFYKIAWIRPLGQYKKFVSILFKSAEDESEAFQTVLQSFRMFTSLGLARNYQGQLPLKEEDHWNAETRSFYEKHALTSSDFYFGAFSYSMCSDEAADLASVESKIAAEKTRLESADHLAKVYGVMPTYAPINWYGDDYYSFPLALANEFAGGDGVNGKPILQFTYQFTTNNNKVSIANKDDCYTPMFDILRGVYDASFRQIAAGLKKYGHPVLLRLNNEMNSDWTSYCGMMTLNDPELFIATWRHFYDLLIAEGVENAILIFNPVTVTTPYCNWGENLAYFPGEGYVHVLGLTNYEMGNGTTLSSFENLYSSTYEKNKEPFALYPSFIGEFACGAGGDSEGLTLGRNASEQAKWVEAMFAELTNRADKPYLSRLFGAVWFSCNDVTSTGKISNFLKLDDSLTSTFKAFQTGFAKLKK